MRESMKSKILLLAAALGVATANADGLWKNLDEAHWYAGPKVTEADTLGKVVMIYSFGGQYQLDKDLLKRVQQIWSSMGGKSFTLIASHRGGRKAEGVAKLVEAYGLTMPIYEEAGLADAEPSATLYVVNHRGKIVYSGSEDRDATEALVTARGNVGRPPDLLPGVALTKARKSLAKKFALGKPLKGEIAKLEKEIKDFEKVKKPTAKQSAKVDEARAILAALENGKKDVKEEIASLKKRNPSEALKLMKDYVKSFPEEADEYKDAIAELSAAKGK